VGTETLEQKAKWVKPQSASMLGKNLGFKAPVVKRLAGNRHEEILPGGVLKCYSPWEVA
jgi:hypothetical protein